MSAPTVYGRTALVQAALGAVNLTAPDARFLALIAPGDDEARRKQVAHESCCYLVALGIQELALNVDARGPYRDGYAPALLWGRAGGTPWQPDGAVRRVTAFAPPGVGDLLVWGTSGTYPAHVEHVVGTSGVGIPQSGGAEGAPVTFEVVAGGERTAAPSKLETVRTLSRQCVWRSGSFVHLATSRKLLAVVCAERLTARYGVRGTVADDTSGEAAS